MNTSLQIQGETDLNGNNLVTLDGRVAISGWSIGGSGYYEASAVGLAGYVPTTDTRYDFSGVDYWPYLGMQLFYETTPLNPVYSLSDISSPFDYYYNSSNGNIYLTTQFNPNGKNMYTSRYTCFIGTDGFNGNTCTNMCNGLVVSNLNFQCYGGNYQNAVIGDRGGVRTNYDPGKYHGVIGCNFYACRGTATRLPAVSTVYKSVSDHGGYGIFWAGYIAQSVTPTIESNNQTWYGIGRSKII